MCIAETNLPWHTEKKSVQCVSLIHNYLWLTLPLKTSLIQFYPCLAHHCDCLELGAVEAQVQLRCQSGCSDLRDSSAEQGKATSSLAS